MKYGLLYYKDTNNIGDDIQSYAASRFLPTIDYLVDRENLETFTPDNREYVKVIMNAWYVHDKFNFDISPYIYPLYISAFFKKFPYEAGITIGSDYLNQNVLDSFKKYAPVGTRDIHTKKLMDKLEIENYFSGCMTLTIKKLPNVKKGNYIVTVGLTDDEIDFIKSKTNREVIKFIQDVKTGSFSNETWEERKQRVEDALRLYQGAHMVITTKLHCSLPCLALETPVLLLYDRSFAENKDRIGTYLPYLNHINREKLKTTKLELEKPKENPREYLKLRKKLEKSCQTFIDKNIDETTDILPSIEEYKINVYKSRNMRELPIKQLSILQKKYEEECAKSSKMYDELNDLKYQYEVLNYKYNLIINSRTWRLASKIKRFIRK